MSRHPGGDHFSGDLYPPRRGLVYGASNQDQEETGKPTNRFSGQGISALGSRQASQGFFRLGNLVPHLDLQGPGAP